MTALAPGITLTLKCAALMTRRAHSAKNYLVKTQKNAEETFRLIKLVVLARNPGFPMKNSAAISILRMARELLVSSTKVSMSYMTNREPYHSLIPLKSIKTSLAKASAVRGHGATFTARSSCTHS